MASSGIPENLREGDTVRVTVDNPGDIGGSGGTSAADDADFVAGTTPGTPAQGVYEATPTQVTDGDLGTIGIDEDRNVKVNIVAGSSAGTEYTEDAAAAADPAGGALILVREDARAGSLTTTDGDNVALRGNNKGEAYVKATDSDALLTTIDADTGAIKTATEAIQAGQLADGHNVTVDNASIAITHAALTELGTAIDTEVQVDVVGALPAGTNAIGKLAANSGVDIGDVDVTSVPRSLSGPGQPGTAVDSYTHAAINLAAGANQVLVSSAASKQIWVYGIGFTVNAAGTVSFQDEDDTAITGIMNFAASSGMAVPPSGNFSMPIWKLGTDKDLEVDIVTSELDGWIDYAIVSV